MTRWSITLASLVMGAAAGTFLVGPVLQGKGPAVAAPAVPKEITSYREVVKKVLPAVVSIEAQPGPRPKAKAVPPRQRPRQDDPMIPEQFRRFFDGLDPRQFEMPDESPRL